MSIGDPNSRTVPDVNERVTFTYRHLVESTAQTSTWWAVNACPVKPPISATFNIDPKRTKR